MSGGLRKIVLPNLRELYVPDPGYIICDADLQGADAQVVAWEAEDEELKSAFRAGLKLHDFNARAMWGDEYVNAPGSTDEGKKGQMYKDIKQGVHLTNYGGAARTLAIVLGWTVHRADQFQKRWFSLHPGIKRWHQRVERALATTGTVYNKFGFSKTYFDRPASVFPEALAWVPQSTVALSCFKGILQARKTYHKPDVKWSLQVHDSAVFQVLKSRIEILPEVIKALHVSIPYDDPLIIPWDVKTSEKSWGEVK